MQKTFDYYRSLNNRSYANLDHEDDYSRYLNRIENIVSKKPKVDLTNTRYMNFLNKCHTRSNNHRSQENLIQVNSENQILLDKIINAKKRKTDVKEDRYMLAMH